MDIQFWVGLFLGLGLGLAIGGFGGAVVIHDKIERYERMRPKTDGADARDNDRVA